MNEKELVDLLMAHIDKLVQRVELLDRRSEDARYEKWVNTKQACELLRVTSRTLHTYRGNGLLPYSQVGSKFYYRDRDIQQLIELNSKPSKR